LSILAGIFAGTAIARRSTFQFDDLDLDASRWVTARVLVPIPPARIPDVVSLIWTGRQ
jgi:hypothetical protein